ncbi:MAG: hypothetical protein VCB81_00250 [Verrucomicrobiia bacterium]
MIPRIQQWLTEHHARLGVPAELQPLVLINVNYKYVESYPIISRVVLWFGKDAERPCLATKITDPGLSREALDFSMQFQDKIDAALEQPLFMKIVDVVDIAGRRVIIEEASPHRTFETDLKFAICGPERSHARFGRTFTAQMDEIGELCGKLTTLDQSGPAKRWGDDAAQLARHFKQDCGFDDSQYPESSIEFMRDALNKLELPNTPVLADFVCPNIFPGPRLIDNVHPKLEEWNRTLPGHINALRFLVPYFYSQPVELIYPDWALALASALADTEHESLIAAPLGKLFAMIGLDVKTQADVIWAFIMYAAIFEMQDKLDFYRESPFMIDGKIDTFRKWTQRLCGVANTEVNADYLLASEENLKAQP